MIAPMTFSEEQLARKFFELGVIKIDIVRGFKLKLHDKNTSAPLSPIFLNLRAYNHPKRGPLTSEMIKTIGKSFYNTARVFQLDYDCVCGVPLAGEPFARAFADASTILLRPLVVKLKKEELPDGTRRVVGSWTGTDNIFSGAKILLVDDLITEAHSKLEAIRALELAGAKVKNVLVIVDRERGGSKQLEKAGYNIYPIFTISQLLEFYFREGMISNQRYDIVLNHIRANR